MIVNALFIPGAYFSSFYDYIIKWKHFLRYWWREFTGNRWILLTKASDAVLWYILWSVYEQTAAKQSIRR